MARFTMRSVQLFMGLVLVITTTGCEQKGPAEQAGANVDKAAKDMGNALNPKGPAEKAGEKLDNAMPR